MTEHFCFGQKRHNILDDLLPTRLNTYLDQIGGTLRRIRKDKKSSREDPTDQKEPLVKGKRKNETCKTKTAGRLPVIGQMEEAHDDYEEEWKLLKVLYFYFVLFI